jgi:apolipoprotein N-acyltransferase
MANSSFGKFTPLLLSVCGGLLLGAAWPMLPFTLLIFIAFVPLLALADLHQNRGGYFGCIFLALLIWNVITTWWVGNTTVPASGVAANVFNALLMSIPWMAYKNTPKRWSTPVKYFSFIVYWLTFEYVHQQWELSWPWLTLGNVFATHTGWIQWYEYTGASGGSLWVLISNITIYSIWQKYKHSNVPVKTILRKEAWKPLTIIILPIAISALIPIPKDNGNKISVVVVQPNIDPYDEKFTAGTVQEQLTKFLTLTEQQLDSTTRYIIWPETALFPHGAWENQLNMQGEVLAIREMLRKYPQAKLITGAVTIKRYGEEVPPLARQLEDGTFYDPYNTALQIDTTQSIQIYHKYKLVPGVELVPYMRYLKFMGSLALDFGGITGSYGREPGVALFTDPTTQIKVFPTICYESVYSEYVAAHVRNGANLLVILTNDGWWGNTAGHKQHLQYARLRAIETRRWVARSANTGISAFIDPQGNIHNPQPYWKEAVIKGTVTTSNDFTFYVRYGDLISRGALIFCILLIVYAIISRFIYRQ